LLEVDIACNMAHAHTIQKGLNFPFLAKNVQHILKQQELQHV